MPIESYKILPTLTALNRTKEAMSSGKWDKGRINQAQAYLNRVARFRKKAKLQKASRKRNRK